MVGPAHAADGFRLALHLERRGEQPRSERLLREALAARSGPWDRRAAHRLAVRLRHGGGAGEEEALSLWRWLWQSDPTDLRAARALAIALERARLLDEATVVCRRSLGICDAMPAWRLAALRGAPATGWRADWLRRLQRIEARQDREVSRKADAGTRASPRRGLRRPATAQSLLSARSA
jgi:hypothetical protein